MLTEADVFGPNRDRETRITAELEMLRVRRDAKRLLEAEDRGRAPIPPFTSLRERLARPSPGILPRIEGWASLEDNVMISAQFKAGKTTLMDNLIRSLVDGDPFLNQYPVTRLTGTVLKLDIELGDARLDAWLAAQGIVHDDRIVPISLRGKGAAFNILDDAVRADWARLMRAAHVETVILDCVGPVMDVLGLDEHRDAGVFLQACAALRAEAGTKGWFLVHHMGHNGERARGDSRFRGWPDVEWRLVREKDEPNSPRFLTAYGRDVDIPESQLAYDATSRRLTIAGGSRKDAKGHEVLTAIAAHLRDLGGKHSSRAIKRAFGDSEFTREQVEDGLKLGRLTQALGTEAGPKNSTLHWASSVPVSGSVPRVSGEPVSSVRPLIRGGRSDTHAGGSSARERV